METGLYTILGSNINIKVSEIVKVNRNSIVLNILYVYKSGMIIDFETVTVPKDSIEHWIKLEE